MPITLPNLLVPVDLYQIRRGAISNLAHNCEPPELSYSKIWKELCRHHATRFPRLALPVGMLGRCLEA